MKNANEKSKLEPLAVTCEELAEMLRLSPVTVRALMQQGKIAVLRVGARRLIPLAEARKFVKQHTRAAPTPAFAAKQKAEGHETKADATAA